MRKLGVASVDEQRKIASFTGEAIWKPIGYCYRQTLKTVHKKIRRDYRCRYMLLLLQLTQISNEEVQHETLALTENSSDADYKNLNKRNL
jgi:hypothetical protein